MEYYVHDRLCHPTYPTPRIQTIIKGEKEKRKKKKEKEMTEKEGKEGKEPLQVNLER
jgi:hypothetical protein